MLSSGNQPVLVFSTYVEVIPTNVPVNGAENGILHVCGGDPMRNIMANIYSRYSPRMWR